MGFLKAFGKYLVHSLFISAVFSLSVSVVAEELSKVDSEALENTVKLLNSPQDRQAVIEGNDGAQKADNMVQQLMGGDPEKVQAAYKVAAELFRSLATTNGGDTQNMMEIIGKAQQDPEGFFKMLSPEQQKMIKSLSEQATPPKSKPNH